MRCMQFLLLCFLFIEWYTTRLRTCRALQHNTSTYVCYNAEGLGSHTIILYGYRRKYIICIHGFIQTVR